LSLLEIARCHAISESRALRGWFAKGWIDFREESDGSIMEEPVDATSRATAVYSVGWYYVALRSVTNRRIVTSHAELKTVLKLLRGTPAREGRAAACGLHRRAISGPSGAASRGRAFERDHRQFSARIRATLQSTHDERGSLFRLHYHVLLSSTNSAGTTGAA